MPIEIEIDSTLFRVHHYLTVHAVASCKFGAQIFLGIGILASCARVLAEVAPLPVLQVGIAAMLAIVVLQLPGFFSVSMRLLTHQCSESCQDESLNIETFWPSFRIFLDLLLNFTGVPVLLYLIGIGFGSVFGILIPFLTASLIFWLLVKSGRAAKLEIESRST